MPSILSKTPPCPGKIFPVFFNDAFLFKNEKNKSPNWTLNETKKPRKILFSNSVLKIYPSSIELVIIEKIKEPKLPDIVLLGLIFVNFGPFNIFPKNIPPISEDIQISNMINKMILKLKTLSPNIKINKKKNI